MLISFLAISSIFLTRNTYYTMMTTLFYTFFISLLFIYSPGLTVSFSSSFILLDSYSSPLISLSIWISALMLLASNKIFIHASNKTLFSLLISTLNMILVLSFSLSSLIMFYILFESSLIPTILLIVGWGYQPERLQASLYLTLYTISASLPLLLMLSWLHLKLGHTSFIMLPHTTLLLTPMSWTIASFLAFMVKLPIFGMHLWLPKAHVEAPIAGSMVLAAILLKLGGYGLIRMSAFTALLSVSTSYLFIAVSVWGGVMTSIICVRQTDMKSLIAYSSIGHMAFVSLGVMVMSSWGLYGAMIMMIAHGLCSSGLFCLANLSYETLLTRSLVLTKGLLMSSPTMSMWWFMFAISNMAAPPSINLAAELAVISGSIFSSFTLMIPLGLSSFLACLYSFILFSSSSHGRTPMFSNPRNANSLIFFTIAALHFIPIFLMISKLETMM